MSCTDSDVCQLAPRHIRRQLVQDTKLEVPETDDRKITLLTKVGAVCLPGCVRVVRCVLLPLAL